MRFLFVGDVVGRPGRQIFQRVTPQLRKEKQIDLVIVNGENSAGGKGFTRSSLDDLYHGGADIVTSGNHVWDKKEVLDFIDQEPYLIRPANYPQGTPGKGYCIYPAQRKSIAFINLAGRAFMPPMDCPFQVAEDVLREVQREARLIFVDIHAETTSEKLAMGYYLDGRVNAVVGTHTHVQTADEHLLPKGTAVISDLGMTGPQDSILGVKPERILEKFLTCRPVRFDVADGPCVYCGVIIETDDVTDRTVSIERVQMRDL